MYPDPGQLAVSCVLDAPRSQGWAESLDTLDSTMLHVQAIATENEV